MFTCTRRIEFDAAHRLRNHESKCRHVHGHRYVVEATFAADALDKVGRVIDFGVVKEKLGGWIDAHWDHTLVLEAADKGLGDSIESHTHQDIYYLPYPPSAENMARYLFEEICPALFEDSDIACTRLRIYETPNCYAEVGE